MLTLKMAEQIVDEALAEGRRRELAPLSIAVLDAGGHVIMIKREDNSSFLRTEIARGKAWGALGVGFGTRAIAEHARAESGPFFGALAALSGGLMIPSPGGVLIRDGSGALIGAVGISGDKGELDEGCAVKAIESLGLVAVVGH